MNQLEKMYTAKVRTTGGCDGASRSSDGRLEVKLSPWCPWSWHQPRADVRRRLVGLLRRSDGDRSPQIEDRPPGRPRPSVPKWTYAKPGRLRVRRILLTNRIQRHPRG
jgi:hypothetical protein